jgi:DNA polymerase III delta subunit
MSAARSSRAGAAQSPSAIPNPLPSVVVLTGDDELGKDEVIAEIVRREGSGADVVDYQGDASGRDGEVTRLARDLATRSLFGTRRVLLVRDGDGLVKRAGADLANLLNTKAGNAIVLRCTKVDARLTFFKRVKETGGLIARERPKADHLDVDPTRGIGESELLRSIVADATARGLRIDPDAAHELAMRVGNDRLAIANEIEKYWLALGGPQKGGHVALRLVDELTPQSAAFEHFRLFQEVATGDLRAAALRIHGLLDRGLLDRSGKRITEPVAIAILVIAIVHQRIATLARYKAAVSRGLTREAIQSELGIKNPGQLFFLQKEAALPLVERAEDAVAALAEADRSVKTGGRAERVLPELVVRLALLARSARQRPAIGGRR